MGSESLLKAAIYFSDFGAIILPTSFLPEVCVMASS